MQEIATDVNALAMTFFYLSLRANAVSSPISTVGKRQRLLLF